MRFSSVFVALAAFAGSAFAADDMKILVPGGSDLWWVANSQNNIVWNCKDTSVQNFTVLLSNTDTKVLTAPIAIVAIQQNFDCSKTLTTQQANFTVAQGYKVIFANPLNSSDVYAETDEFEVKSQGSAYPDASATPNADGSSTASGASSTSTDASQSSSGALSGLPGPLTNIVGLGSFIGAVAALVL